MPKVAQLPVEERRPRERAPEMPRIPRRQTRYFAFLSYSHKDEKVADWLHSELEGFHVPAALVGRLTEHGVMPSRLTPIFRDRHELAAADDLGAEIQEALAASQYLIVLCSPAAAKSRWTNAEIDLFKRTRPDGCVLAAIVAGEPFASDIPGREDEECFPPALRHRYDRRGRMTNKRAEPLAADLRGEGEARRTGLLQLIAGMLGVGLDELVQRETTRRHRRLAFLAAASIAGMAVTSSFAVVALQARDAARDQRREAEGLVAFMLGDLKDKLEPIGRLDALDGVGSRVLAYYSKQDASELSDAGLLQRSRALSLTAQVAYLRGDLNQAQALYSQAISGTGEAVRRAPNDTKRLYEHAQNVFWVGELARAKGQTDQAVSAFSEYKRLADRLIAIEPDNLKWRMEVLYGDENLGISLYNKRRFAEAARQFESALRPMQSLAALEPENATYQKELSTVIAWLADAKRAQGKLDEAIALRERQVALLSRMAASGQRDLEFRRELIPARQGLAILLVWRGQTERGIEELRAAVSEAERLIPVEPANTVWKSLAAGARLELGRTLLLSGDAAQAARQTDAACALIAAVRPADLVAARRTSCLTMRAQLALARGSHGEALLFAQRALASAREVHSEDPLKDRYTAAGIHRLMGDARRAAGDTNGATVAWSNALAVMPSGVAEMPMELNERATVLQRLGRRSEEGQIASRLESMGYRRST